MLLLLFRFCWVFFFFFRLFGEGGVCFFGWFGLVTFFLSFFLSFCLLGVFGFFFFLFSLNRTSSANRKFVGCSLSTLIPSEISACLQLFSIAAVKSYGEIGSPSLTPQSIGNLSDTELSIYPCCSMTAEIFCLIFTYVSLMLIFRKTSKSSRCFVVSKAFFVINETCA